MFLRLPFGGICFLVPQRLTLVPIRQHPKPIWSLEAVGRLDQKSSCFKENIIHRIHVIMVYFHNIAIEILLNYLHLLPKKTAFHVSVNIHIYIYHDQMGSSKNKTWGNHPKPTLNTMGERAHDFYPLASLLDLAVQGLVASNSIRSVGVSSRSLFSWTNPPLSNGLIKSYNHGLTWFTWGYFTPKSVELWAPDSTG